MQETGGSLEEVKPGEEKSRYQLQSAFSPGSLGQKSGALEPLSEVLQKGEIWQARIQCPRQKLEVEEGLIPPPAGASIYRECLRLFTSTIPLVLRVIDLLYS